MPAGELAAEILAQFGYDHWFTAEDYYRALDRRLHARAVNITTLLYKNVLVRRELTSEDRRRGASGHQIYEFCLRDNDETQKVLYYGAGDVTRSP